VDSGGAKCTEGPLRQQRKSAGTAAGSRAYPVNDSAHACLSAGKADRVGVRPLESRAGGEPVVVAAEDIVDAHAVGTCPDHVVADHAVGGAEVARQIKGEAVTGPSTEVPPRW
jgi:hypothetical protein